MPVQPTYPGVYIQEIPSGVRTISGVSTSVTAFIGPALRGPVDQPVIVNNYGDYQRAFGGLSLLSPMSYAVRDFFANGGGQAVIVRLYKAKDENTTGKSALKLTKGLELEALNPGTWGNKLKVRIDHDVSEEVAKSMGLTKDDLFNITIRDDNSGTVERFINVTVADKARKVDKVLENGSSLMKVTKNATARPDETSSGKAKSDDSSGNVKSDDDAAFKAASGGADSESLNFADDAGKTYLGDENQKTGLYALEHTDLFNLLCIPPSSFGAAGDIDKSVYEKALSYCVQRRAMLVVDPPTAWATNTATAAQTAKTGLATFQFSGTDARNAAMYFPRIRQPNPLRDGQIETFAPCGAVAGVMARTDAQRGVWKAPAGLDAGVSGVRSLEVTLTDAENGMLNPLGLNCLRTFRVGGTVIWGARTTRGADQLADEYKYVPVRRLALFIEESLYRGTQWAVFEPNDEPLWAQIRLNIGAFMHNLFRQGAFQGSSPRDAYFVKCDSETTTQNDINLGVVNIIVGFAPLKPAEFVIISLQQIAGSIDT